MAGGDSSEGNFGAHCPTGNHIVSLSGTSGNVRNDVCMGRDKSHALFTDMSSVLEPLKPKNVDA